VLVPSGVGKSTLVNRLVPEAGAQTGEISRALNTGRHTTTSTTWYWLDAARESALIDSPGFQEFGLHHLEAERLAQLMPDLRATLGDCRFYNCTRSHVGADPASDPLAIDETRYRLYNELFDELANKRLY
jgi:ribosome biogenesis GTPase / thiamine phosphate phosphatase